MITINKTTIEKSSFIRGLLMKKTYRLGMLTFLLMFASFLESAAQQRRMEQVESIALKVNKNNKLYGYSNTINSTELLSKGKIASDKSAFYIYSAESEGKNSFTIVSGDERMPEILAYSSDCKFNVDSIPPAVRYWLECYVKEYNALDDNDASDISSHKNVFSGEVAPLLGKTQWGQSEPFNLLCPTYGGNRTVTGCVATVMAQVMRYYSYPERGKGSVSYTTETNHLNVTHDFSKDLFDWSNMRDYYGSDYTYKQANAVAELMASCGAAVKMDYCTNAQGGSAASTLSLLKGYIETFSYDDDAALVLRKYCSTEDWHELLVNELKEGRPVSYSGTSNYDGGHAFIIDGYQTQDDIEYPFYHVNWGWNGYYDGYYQIANLRPQDGDYYATNGPFSEGQYMIVGVKPEDDTAVNTSLLQSAAVNCYVDKVKSGDDFTCDVSSIYNGSYKTFKGNVSVALKDASGKLVNVSNRSIFGTLQCNYLYSNQWFSCFVPDDIDTGKYSVCLVYRYNDTDNWKEILSVSCHELEVINPTAVSEVKEVDTEKGEWYSVDGTKVEGSNASHGVYIRKYKGKTEKVLLP